MAVKNKKYNFGDIQMSEDAINIPRIEPHVPYTTELARTFSRLYDDALENNPITKYKKEKENEAKRRYFENLNATKPRTGKVTDITKEYFVNPVTNVFEAVTNPPKKFKWNSKKEVYEQVARKSKKSNKPSNVKKYSNSVRKPKGSLK